MKNQPQPTENTMLNQELSTSICIVADDVYDLRDRLNDIYDLITTHYDIVNSAIHQAEKDLAFIEYCRTGKFPG